MRASPARGSFPEVEAREERRDGEARSLRAESMDEALKRVKAWLSSVPPQSDGATSRAGVQPRVSTSEEMPRRATPESVEPRRNEVARFARKAKRPAFEVPAEAPVELSIGTINVTIEEQSPKAPMPPQPVAARSGAGEGRERGREGSGERRADRLGRHYLRDF